MAVTPEKLAVIIGPVPVLPENPTCQDILNFYNEIHNRTQRAAAAWLADSHEAAKGFVDHYFGGVNGIVKQQGEELVILRSLELMLRLKHAESADYDAVFALLDSFRNEVSVSAKAEANATQH